MGDANVRRPVVTRFEHGVDFGLLVHKSPFMADKRDPLVLSHYIFELLEVNPLRRHKLPSPHLALWPTEVHVVMRGKVCEKGCYFLGIQTPLVATCKNKVCISNICHYLHFWKHTDFQNKNIQSPKYSVVLHLDHCIPVWGGGGCLFFSPLCSSLITEPPYTPQMREPQTYLSLKHTENYPKACTCISYFNQPGRNFGQLFEKCPNTWSYLTNRPKLAEISARSIETPNMITEMGT